MTHRRSPSLDRICESFHVPDVSSTRSVDTAGGPQGDPGRTVTASTHVDSSRCRRRGQFSRPSVTNTVWGTFCSSGQDPGSSSEGCAHTHTHTHTDTDTHTDRHTQTHTERNTHTDTHTHPPTYQKIKKGKPLKETLKTEPFTPVKKSSQHLTFSSTSLPDTMSVVSGPSSNSTDRWCCGGWCGRSGSRCSSPGRQTPRGRGACGRTPPPETRSARGSLRPRAGRTPPHTCCRAGWVTHTPTHTHIPTNT